MGCASLGFNDDEAFPSEAMAATVDGAILRCANTLSFEGDEY